MQRGGSPTAPRCLLSRAGGGGGRRRSPAAEHPISANIMPKTAEKMKDEIPRTRCCRRAKGEIRRATKYQAFGGGGGGGRGGCGGAVAASLKAGGGGGGGIAAAALGAGGGGGGGRDKGKATEGALLTDPICGGEGNLESELERHEVRLACTWSRER